jgi:methylated-DNA-protein-cysteine methyltransferase-like protein
LIFFEFFPILFNWILFSLMFSFDPLVSIYFNQGMNYQSSYLKIYRTVRQVPRGRVATYGQIAREAGLPGQARLVGYALHMLSADSDVPWHRVINARGEISRLPDPDAGLIQRRMLESEGVRFDESGRINLQQFRWQF